MRKSIFSLCASCTLVFVACAGKNESGEIESIVKKFYSSGYDYEKITTSYEDDNLVSEVIVEGQIIQEPYKEHVELVSSTEESLWDELYYDKYSCTIVKDGNMQKTPSNPQKPYGYGKEIIYEEPKESIWEGNPVTLYDAHYTVDIGKSYQIKENLCAVVRQQYYIDPEKRTLIRISTDLTELNKMNEIAINISVNEMSYEEAVAAYEQSGEYRNTEEVNIFNYNNPTEFDEP